MLSRTDLVPHPRYALTVMFLYMQRESRIVLPQAVAAQQRDELTEFLDEDGRVVALVDTADLWLYADHDLATDDDETMPPTVSERPS